MSMKFVQYNLTHTLYYIPIADPRQSSNCIKIMIMKLIQLIKIIHFFSSQQNYNLQKKKLGTD